MLRDQKEMFMLSHSESNQTMNDLRFELLLCFASMRQANQCAQKARQHPTTQLAGSDDAARPALLASSSQSHA
jgi:hypothetical protein